MTKILLVEDDKSLREIYGVRLLAEGYDIVSAGDGEEALAMAIKERPRLIISDVMMPKISGFDMLDILRSTTETREVKVIMMTALSSEDQRARGEALGADRYLVKSQVGIEDVVRTVHEVLGDAPVALPTGPAAFRSGPVSSVPPRPIAPPAPTAPAQPAMAPVAPAVVPAPQPTPLPAPGTVQPTAPYDTTAPSLPQPTAPFSTPRPSGLGDRIIQPLTNTGNQQDYSKMINDELTITQPIAVSDTAPLGPVAQPATPAPQPIPDPAVAPTTQPVSNSDTAFPTIGFEETPRPPSTS